MLKRSFQQKNHDFPLTKFGKKNRRFYVSSFEDYPTWLEYSIKKDAAFWLCCYLFKIKCGSRNNDSFVTIEYNNWKKPNSFARHIGEHNGIHDNCQRACGMLMNRKQHTNIALSQQSDKVNNDYRVQLIAAIDCV